MSPALVRDFGWVLIHFLWQGAALAAIVPPLTLLCRSAAQRYAAMLAVLALMAAAPVATFLALTRPDGAAGFAPTGFAPAPAPALLGAVTAAMTAPDTPWLEILVCSWIAGVLVLSLRLAGGWVVLERLRRDTGTLPPALLRRCRVLQQRLGLGREIAFVQSARLAVPAVIGWFRPIVLVPVSALAGLSPAQLDAVILHELAHIKRLDAFANLFQILVETLLFYHPAVWWLNRRIRIEREHCCDDVAVAMAGDAVDFALALTLLEAERALPAALLAATGNNAPDGAFKQRILRLLGPRHRRPVRRPPLALALAVLIGLAVSISAGRALAVDPDPAAPHQIVMTDGAQDPEAIPPVPPVPAASAVPSVPAAPQAPPAPPAPPAPAGSHSYVGALAAAGLTDLSVDELIALKNAGVSPDYIAAMNKAGFKPSVDDLIALKNSGVDPDYIAAMNKSGFKPSIDDLIALKSTNVNPDYIAAMNRAGFEPSVGELVTLRSVGVRPEDMDAYLGFGFSKLTLNDIMTFKSVGVTPEYIRAMQAAGFGEQSASDYVSARSMGITPDFITALRSHGLNNLSMSKMMALKAAGVF
jgi:beta-lactamase regulating signal transducer with metallopeptidase domain